MVDINQIITFGIGTPASIAHYMLMGLSPGQFLHADEASVRILLERNTVRVLADRATVRTLARHTVRVLEPR